MNSAGMMAKYFATSLAIENVVSAPRVMSSCLPISTMSSSLVGLESRSTMLPASLAAVVPVFIATPTSAWASAGASFVPSPVMATSLPPSCSCLMSASLFSGVASARKSSTPGLVGDRRGRERVVAGDHDRADPHRAHLVEALPDPLLDDVLQLDDAEHGRRRRRRRAESSRHARCARRSGRGRSGSIPPCSVTQRFTASAAPLRTWRPSTSRPDIRVDGREGDEGVLVAEVALADVETLLGEHDDRAALGRLVRERRQLGGVGHLSLVVAADRHELRRHPVAERDRARLVEQQRLGVAGRLDGAAAHGEHVALHEPVHAGDADRREQGADRGRDQADEQGDEDDDRDGRPGVVAEGLQRHARPGGR